MHPFNKVVLQGDARLQPNNQLIRLSRALSQTLTTKTYLNNYLDINAPKNFHSTHIHKYLNPVNSYWAHSSASISRRGRVGIFFRRYGFSRFFHREVYFSIDIMLTHLFRIEIGDISNFTWQGRIHPLSSVPISDINPILNNNAIPVLNVSNVWTWS